MAKKKLTEKDQQLLPIVPKKRGRPPKPKLKLSNGMAENLLIELRSMARSRGFLVPNIKSQQFIRLAERLKSAHQWGISKTEMRLFDDGQALVSKYTALMGVVEMFVPEINQVFQDLNKLLKSYKAGGV